MTLETRPGPWIDALRSSHDRLRAVVEPLGADRLGEPSYCSGWSIAQVLSHLGSQAEIFGMFLDAGLSGREPPGRDAFPAVWDRWNARTPEAQVADGLAADEAMLERLEALDADQRDHLRLQVFGMDVDTTGLARMRVGEHAVHSWDVAVALDPTATLAPDAVVLLVDGIGPLAARTGRPEAKTTRLHLLTSSPERRFTLEATDGVTLTATPDGEDAGADTPELRLPAESLIRLVYGRLDPAHTPPVEARGVDAGELRRMFPGL
jgi:uncharacterized protein (TIGR03083 family)